MSTQPFSVSLTKWTFGLILFVMLTSLTGCGDAEEAELTDAEKEHR